MDRLKVLIVDDDEVSRNLLSEVLSRAGYDAMTAGSGEEALSKIRNDPPPLVLSDIRMLEMSGLDLLREIRASSPQSVVVLMTGFGSMEGALEAIREGAFDYLSKPFRMDEMKSVVARAAKHHEALRSPVLEAPRATAAQVHPGMLGSSPRIVEVYKLMARAALSSSSVLITGEAGTGKALIAKTIHEKSALADRNYWIVNPEALHAPDFEDRLERARGSTVVVEDISELPPALQSRLARAIEVARDSEFGIRWMALSRRTLSELTAQKRVREDLLYPLGVIVIEIPALRERSGDLTDMISAYIAKFNAQNQKRISHLTSRAMDLLKSHSWPGNVRELERVIERAVALSSASVLDAEDFGTLQTPDVLPIVTLPPESVVNLEEIERRHILQVLKKMAFNKSKAAEALGIDRATLYRKARAYGIELKAKPAKSL